MKLAALLPFLVLAACGPSPKKKAPPVAPVAPHVEPAGGPVALAENEGVASKNNSFLVRLRWLDEVTSEKYLRAELTFADAARGIPAQVAGVAFEPWMPSMGHGTAVDDQTIAASATDANVFTVGGIYLIMGGAWEMRVTATVDGVTDTAAVAARAP